MRALVQTVSRASVTVDDQVVGKIDDGLLVLVGVTHDDTPAKAAELARKTYELRILDDDASASDLGAPLLVISQFTLYRDARSGRHRRDRPISGAHARRERQRRTTDRDAGALAQKNRPRRCADCRNQ